MLDPTKKIFSTDYPNPFGITGNNPDFADIDNDGDMDAFVGNHDGNTQFFENIGTTNQPAFAVAQTNPFGLTDVGEYAVPTFADIDGDADLDAFIGEDGKVLFFENTGSVNQAVFVSAKINPFGLTDVGWDVAPNFADIDGDRDLDAFIGEDYGNIRFFKNIGSINQPAFTAVKINPFGLTDIGWNATPTFADIDGDRDLDAFIGGGYGDTVSFENIGSVSEVSFTSPISPFGLTDVGSYAVPTFADIDGDGDLDAFIGEWYGNTLFFENTGSFSQPAFADAKTNPFGLADIGFSTVPILADIDTDGDLDAFIGEYDGNTLFFENIGTAKQPVFAAMQTNPFGLVDVGYNAAPTFVDIDSDGDLDAFIGQRYDSTLFFENTGSVNQPAFAAAKINPFGLADLGGYAAPTFADIDGDDDLDAFISTLFFENTGSVNQPTFADAKSNPFGLDFGDTAPTFADIDGDNDLDAFIGNVYGITIYFQNNQAISGTEQADNLDGSADNDILNGLGGGDHIDAKDGNDTLDGGSGSDTLIGGAGNDTYYADKIDTIQEAENEGKDTVQSSTDYNLPENLENLTLTGAANLTGDGNALDNVVKGNSGANRLNGNEGDDSLDGGGATDSMNGGAGSDTYTVDNADDVVTETSDLATDLDTVNSAVDYTLPDNVENLSLFGSASKGKGNALANVLIGTDGKNVLSGFEGEDTLSGGAKKDGLWGWEGDDVQHGEDGNDTLGAWRGHNKLDGGTGNDTLICGKGNNVLTGAEGLDTFVFKQVSSSKVTDFVVGEDAIELNSEKFTSLNSGVLSAANFNIGTQAADADDYVTYTKSSGELFYDADGNGVEPAVQIALIGANLELTNADFVVI